MADRKSMLIDVFEDTCSFIKENKVLSDAVANSSAKTKFFSGDDYPEIGRPARRVPSITVSKKRSFEAAVGIHAADPDAKICVLNFASPVTPGGGVKYGSSAQEECLCRCSTLYPVLNRKNNWQNFYEQNRDRDDPLGTDAIIYTPDIVICKTDVDMPERLSLASFVKVDVITCAAPNLKKVAEDEYSFLTLYTTHMKRAKHILHVAAAQGVNAIVLGAFGCGAFRNTPNVVAQSWNDVLDEYKGYFSTIEFAVFCNRWDTNNYDVFRHCIKI